ncbi:hypothetical protein VNO78_15678 [Psophocarpus tetragonolobus]|uniref:Uncharacterized protein n=1 Tax=Psophocarpus tetragonolobus TaxID=3891 RepID=A0AAN9SFE5_PSOTE
MLFIFPHLQSMKFQSLWLLVLVMWFYAFKMTTSSLTTSSILQWKEANVLLKWKASLDNQSRALLSSWASNSPYIWFGITYDHSNSVSNITLRDIGLSEICQLVNLGDLRLQENMLSGFIPREMGNLVKMMLLWPGDNNLSGFIPHEIGMMTNMYQLDLSSKLDQHLPCLTNPIALEIVLIVRIVNTCLTENPYSCPTMEQVSSELAMLK